MRIIVVLLCLFVCACGPPEDKRTLHQKAGTYPTEGDFRAEPVAAVVVERGGRFDVASTTGSAFLVGPKESGRFATARHVVALDTEYKLFFCGRVYKARRKLDAGVTDVGFLEIAENFDPSGFPEPYPLGGLPNKGDRAFIRGIHMHRESLQKDKTIHRITGMYYGIKEMEVVNGKLETKEFVYDNLPATVAETDALLRNSSVANRARGELDDVVQAIFSVKAAADHIISFGGLSGGPTVNERGELIGINSNEIRGEGERVLESDGLVHYYPRVTLNLLPLDELKRALERLR